MNEAIETPQAGAPTMGLGSRLMNVLAAPGEVFEAVRNAPHAVTNWLIPVFTFVLVMMVGGVLIMMQPAFAEQFREMQIKAIDQQVEQGKLKAEDAAKAKEMFEKMPAWLPQVFVVIGGILVGGVGWLWWSFLLWLLGSKILGGGFGFVKAMEAAGLAHVILILGLIIQTLLTMATGNLMARLAPSIFLGEFDATNRLHLALGALNLVYMWFAAVIAVAASRLGNLPLSRCLSVVFGVWVLLRVVLIGLSPSFGSLFL